MAFPQDRLPIKQELLINGVWTDVTSYTRNSDNVNISRGYSSEQSNLSSSQASFTLNNRDGRFSNRNPTSPYYRQIGRNTQYRVSVTEATNFIHFRDYSIVSTGLYDNATVSTADKAALDIVGDIDVRIDIEPDNWQLGTGAILAAKYGRTGNQRSWAFFISKLGIVTFYWTQDGTGATLRGAASTVALPMTGRIAIRATLDVDNGASNNTATFYTAPTIGGTWTALGAPVIGGGVTNIYSGTALLEVGNVDSSPRGGIFGDVYPLVGRVYGFQLRNGIGGTLVANMDPSTRSPGDIIWIDTATGSNTWQTAHTAPVSNSDYRFWGEISKLPQRWDASGRDVYVPVSAADMLQRLSQGDKALQSPIFRNLSQYDTSGYWPLEAGATDGSAFSSYTGRASQLVSGNFGADPTLPGSAGALTFGGDDGYASAYADVVTQTDTTFEMFYFKMPSVPLVDTPIIQFYHKGGRIYRVQVVVGAAAYTLTVLSIDGLTLFTSTVGFGALAAPNQWIGMRIRIVTGPFPTYLNQLDWAWYAIGTAVFYGSSGSFSGAVTGRVESWISFPYSGKSGLSLAHVLLANQDVGFVEAGFYGSTNGYIGETAGERAIRLSKEEKVPFWVVGNYSNSYNELMGAQSTSTYLDLIKECADVAGGLLYSPRDKFGLALRLRTGLLNQNSVSLSYSSNHFSGSLEPDESDALIRNDVTVQRPNGSSARAVKLTGTLNTGDPTTGPDAVGTYDTTITLNTSSDARLPALAAREVFLGTWDELRYTKVQMEMERAPFVASASLTRSVRALDIGDPFTITGLPRWLPPEDVENLIIGYAETLKNRGQQLVYSTTPYGPYRQNDLTGSTRSRQRASASNSSTSATSNTTVTSIVVKTPTGALWSTSAAKPANFPLDIMIAGERMTVTAIVGTSSPQTFTVTRSVNGVVKSHIADETVQVFDIFYAGII